MWEAFKDLIFQIITFFYNPIGDWGMAIIVVTILFRICISPLMIKQTRVSFQMQQISPKIKALQEKYADDPRRQQEEMQRIYADAGFNPLAGCLPMLLQMPIFIALFQTLRDMGSRVDATAYSFYNIIPSLITTPSMAFKGAFIDFLPYLILMIIFAFATFLPMLIQQSGNTDPKQRKQMMIMAGVMSVMMLWISWSSPAGVLLFWGTSSIVAVATTQGVRAKLSREQKAQEAEAPDFDPTDLNVVRKEKKKRPRKKN